MHGIFSALFFLILIDTIIMFGVSNTDFGQKVGQPITSLITNRKHIPGIKSGHVTRSNLIEISPIDVVQNNRKKSDNLENKNKTTFHLKGNQLFHVNKGLMSQISNMFR